MRRAFDIRSPSHKMQEIIEQFFAGAEKPIEEASKKLPSKVSKIADDMLKGMDLSDDTQYLRNRLASSGLNTQITGIQDIISSAIFSQAMATAASAHMVDRDKGSKGDIIQNVTINSPKSLSPSETAREYQKAARQLALELN